MRCAAPGGLLRSGVRGKRHTGREGRPISPLLDPIGRRRSTSSTPTESRSERWKEAKKAVFKGAPWGGKKVQAHKTGIRLQVGRSSMPSSCPAHPATGICSVHSAASSCGYQQALPGCTTCTSAAQIHRSHRPLSVPASDPFPTKVAPGPSPENRRSRPGGRSSHKLSIQTVPSSTTLIHPPKDF